MLCLLAQLSARISELLAVSTMVSYIIADLNGKVRHATRPNYLRLDLFSQPRSLDLESS